MKIKNNGKLNLGSGDYRVGNFVYEVGRHYIVLQDLGGLMRLSVSKGTPLGVEIGDAIDNRNDDFLQAYAAVRFNSCMCVADHQFLKELNEVALSCLKRHGDLYGVKGDLTDEEDAEILKEEQDIAEAIEKARDEVANS